MTITQAEIGERPDLVERIVTEPGVYAPQDDSRLLIRALERTGVVVDRRVLDLCTGSGVLAVAAAQLGAAAVSAFDICPRAVRCSQANAGVAGVEIDARVGTLADALACGPFDVVVSNPPYVPESPDAACELVSPTVGPAWAWNAGDDGRSVLDPLCDAAPDLLRSGGTMLVVQSEFSGVAKTLKKLRSVGLAAKVILEESVPFGPVLRARAQWLESTGRLQRGRRDETLVVIRADKSR